MTEHAPGGEAFYRTSDPIEKLRIKLTIREVSRTVTLGADAKRDEPFSREFVLQWQEKLHSPTDVAEYIKHREYKTKPRAGVDQEHFRHLERLEHGGTRAEDLLQDVMLYTYTDRDHYSPEMPPPAAISSGMEPYLGAAISGSGGLDDAAVSERQRKVKARVLNEKPFREMHVCLATDVDVKTLREDKPWMPSKFFVEHRLLSLRLYNDGLVEMAPELSRIRDEAAHDVGGASASVFLSNKTVAAGLRTGMRLATYKVRSAGGSEFEYSIENASDFSLPAELDQARLAAMAADAYAASSARSDGVWAMDPPCEGADETIAYYGEIVSGQGFEGETLFVSYHISYPPEWRARTGNLVDAVNEDVIKKMATGRSAPGNAVSRQDQQMAAMVIENDGYDDGAAALGMLQGTTHTSHARAYRSSASLPTLRPRWKGKYLSFQFDEASRVVWGCSFFLLTVISIVVGVEYPFWLIPCLVFVFGLGTGYPGGSQQVVLRRPQAGKSGKEGAEKVLVGPAVVYPRAVFNHLISASFDRRAESAADLSSREAPSSLVPTLVLQVYSVGLFGRVSLEGYGYHHLPGRAGSCDVEIKTWRPLGGIESQMADHFLGSSVRLADPDFVHLPSDLRDGMAASKDAPGARSAVVLNRFGVRSETSGEIRFRCHAITCSPSAAQAQQQAKAPAPKTRSVDDILKSYNSASNSNLRATFNASMSASLGGTGLSASASREGLGLLGNRASREDSAALARRANELLAQAKERAKLNPTLSKDGPPDDNKGIALVPLVSRSLEASPFVQAVAEDKEAKGLGSVRAPPRGRYSDSEDDAPSGSKR